jgi:hypothetical protein
MRAVATLDICGERVDGTFEITALGAPLQKDAPDSLVREYPGRRRGKGLSRVREEERYANRETALMLPIVGNQEAAGMRAHGPS